MSTAAQAPPVVLEFDAPLHRYTVGGVVLPSVTQVLESVGIIDYSFIPPSTRNMALARGSAVHAAIALDIEGDLEETGIEEIMPYVEAARSARRDLGLEHPEVWEHRLYSERYRYAGTLDMKCGPVIVDWKTNKAEWWVALQLAAYAALFPEPLTLQRLCIELHPDGTYTPYPFKATTFRSDFETFLAALRVHNCKQERKPLR